MYAPFPKKHIRGDGSEYYEKSIRQTLNDREEPVKQNLPYINREDIIEQSNILREHCVGVDERKN